MAAILVVWMLYTHKGFRAEAAQPDGEPLGLLISVVHFGLEGLGGYGEAFCLTNVSAESVVLSNTWGVQDDEGDEIWLTTGGVVLLPDESI